MQERVTRRQLMAAAGVGAAGLYASPAWAGPRTGRGSPMLRYYYPVPREWPRTITSDVCVYGGTSAGTVPDDTIGVRIMGRDGDDSLTFTSTGGFCGLCGLAAELS